jgi:mannonate dehydratase
VLECRRKYIFFVGQQAQILFWCSTKQVKKIEEGKIQISGIAEMFSGGILIIIGDLLKIFSDLGVKDICYNFMAGVNWYRSNTTYTTRGGALASGFSIADVQNKTIDLNGVNLTKTIVEDNHRYFLDRVLPVAESLNMHLALHPDDPPMDPFLNCPRIASSVASYDKILNEFNSSSLGITFCQSNFKLMGGNLKEIAKKYAKQGKIFFIHFRDVEGDVNNFHETFHDNGPTDMAEMMDVYMKYCPNAFIRPDHVPTLAGENNKNFGYTMGGRLFAIGYMRALMQAFDYKRGI